MPSVKTTQRGGVIRWDRDDWLQGQVPFAQLSPGSSGMLSPYAILEGKGFAFSQGIDPFRNPGLISPGFAETALTNSSTVDAAISGTCNYLGDAYLISSGSKIFHLGINSNAFDASAWRTIVHGAHTSIAGEDIIIYKSKVSSTSTVCTFYSFNDGTDGDIGRYTGSFDDDFMSTVPTGAAVLSKDYPHPMIVGTDDILYIGNGSVVAAYDGQEGTDGQFTPIKLQLPTDYIINSFQNLPNYLVIFANKKGLTAGNYASESTVFFWDKTSADPTYKFNVDTFYISASFQYGSTVGCFGVGGSGAKAGGAGFVKLFMYDGTKFDLIKNMPASVSGSVPRSGVVVLDETIYFTSLTSSLGGGGGPTNAIFSYGKDFLGKWSLNCIAITTNANASFLDSFKDQNFYTEGSTGNEPVRLYTDYYANAKFITPHFSPPFPPEQRGRIKKLKVQWGNKASTGRDFELRLNLNKGNTQVVVAQGIGNSPNTITESNLMTNYLRDYLGYPLGKYFFESICLEGVYTGGSGASGIPPLLEFVEVYYDTTKI